MIEITNVNGIKVVNIKNQSGIAFFGIAVLAGSNFETPNIAGISHFSEHLYFKGTNNRNWKQINEEFAKLGVQNNAYTDNLEVVYHATCPKDNIEPTINLMLDMFFNSTIPQEEMEKERNVISEEKKMYEDEPNMSFINKIANNFFDWQIGHDIIGTFDTIKSVSREDVIKYLISKTSLENFLFVCCGDINTDDLKKCISKNIPQSHPYLRNSTKNIVGVDNIWKNNSKDKIKFTYERENITQSSAYLIMESLKRTDPDYHVNSVLLKACGGGMFSLLFSRIREELGLCYSCGMSTWNINYPNNNFNHLYGFISPENVDRFIMESEKVLADVVANGLNKDIFQCAKTDLLSSILRNTETSAGKAERLIRELLVFGEASLDDTINQIKSVTIDDCNDLAKKLFVEEKYNWAVMIPEKD